MTKVLVLGGGPAGYIAAGRAAQLGAEVTLVAPPTLLPVGVESWDAETSYDLDSVLP